MPQPRDAGDSGIRIRRETIITIDGENSSLGPEESTRTTIKSGAMDTHLQQQYGRPKAFRKLSNASSIISDIFRHPDTTEDLLRWKIKRANDRDASRELIDFLRNTPPPLNNFMSIPDTYGRKPEPKRKRHPFFWALRKKLGMARAECNAAASPGLIRLPDSAVAGRTIGGHRHIAISIPIEHAHLSPVLRPIEYNWTRPSSPTVETQGLARLNLDRSVVSVLEPVDENRESIESQSGTGTPVIPPISQDMFSLLLDPGESLESPATDLTVPSTEEMPRELNPLHSRTADASVGAQSAIVVPPPRLTAPHKDFVSNLYSMTGRSPINILPRHSSLDYITIHDHELPDGALVRHHQWGWSSETDIVRARPSVPGNVGAGHSEPELSNTAFARNFWRQPVIMESPPNLASLETDIETTIYAPEFDMTKRRSALTILEDVQISSDSDRQRIRSQMSFSSFSELVQEDGMRSPGSAETEERPTRFYTPDCQPAHQFPISTNDTESTTTAKSNSSLRFTPVMTVVDVQPLPPAEGSQTPDEETTPQLPINRGPVFSTRLSSSYLFSDSSDLMSQPKSEDWLRQRVPKVTLTNNNSIERILLARRSELATASINENSAQGTSSPPVRDELLPQHHIPRTESHRELVRRYKELCETRDRELEVLLERLERLESNSDRWLNAILPMFESISQRLKTPTSEYHNTSLTQIESPVPHEAAPASDLRGHFGSVNSVHQYESGHFLHANSATHHPQQHRQRHNSIPPISNHLGRGPFTHSNQQQHLRAHSYGGTGAFQGHLSDLTFDSEDDSFVANNNGGSGYGTGVAVDRLPSRHGEQIFATSVDFASRTATLQTHAKQYQDRVGGRTVPRNENLSLTGLETLEPVMRDVMGGAQFDLDKESQLSDAEEDTIC